MWHKLCGDALATKAAIDNIKSLTLKKKTNYSDNFLAFCKNRFIAILLTFPSPTKGLKVTYCMSQIFRVINSYIF